METTRQNLVGRKKLTQQPDEPVEGQEVEADLSRPFEAPAKEFVPGPFYMGAEEVMPELEVEEQAEADPAQSPKLPVDRRDFMRLFSASALVASAASCVRRPEEKAIPYVDQPVDYAVGVPTYFATTCGECTSGCGVVVKTRGGRPVKIEGNPEHPVSQGASCALGQATLQDLYHPERRKKPIVRTKQTEEQAEWRDVFKYLAERLQGKKNVAILTHGSTGSRNQFIETFLEQVGSSKDHLYVYEANSLTNAIEEAHKIAFDAPGMPRSDMRAAQTIVGIGTDFLEIGTSPMYHAKSFWASHTFQRGRKSKFYQFESGMSQTGAKADYRYAIPPGYEIIVALQLVRSLLGKSKSKGSARERAEIQKIVESNKGLVDSHWSELGIDQSIIDKLADELLQNKALVLCGGSTNFDQNATALQLVGIMANVLIGAYGSTLFFDHGWMNNPSRPGDLQRFFDNAENIDALFVINTDPVHALPPSFEIEKILEKIPFVVSVQNRRTATDEFANIVLPAHHYLESWGDEQPVAGFYSPRQPAVRAITDSRQAEDMLLWIAAAMDKPLSYREYREYLLERWRGVYNLVGMKVEYDTFFDAVLRRGFVGRLQKRSVRSFSGVNSKLKIVEPKRSGLRLVAPLDVRLREGRGANKPILQEVGDSMTSIAWDTWVALNPNTAKKMGFRRNDVLKVEGAGGVVEVALYPLPGLHPDAVYIPRGNGFKKGVSRVTDGYGVNPLLALAKSQDSFTGDIVTAGQTVKLTRTGKSYPLAAMQKHNDIANRSDIVKKVTLDAAKANQNKTKDLDDVPDLYPKLDEADYRWGMSVDLTACTGCSACMVACATENNVPQVGRQQILLGREMHWIRLDRYFAGSVDDPEVTYQPVMCQHCNHAPCEAVCPVFATTHDPEGFNAQTYNRCIGTRYCANACPYKVRRFNWFTHRWNVIGKMERNRNPRALNPDVTVRTRGVMEKCTFCVQRVRDAKHLAKERGSKVRDGMVKTACQQACPSNAIVFGDLKDERSMVAQLRRDNRAYLMLNGDHEHKHYGLKTLPNVSYLAEVTHEQSVINKQKHHSKADGDASEHHG